MAQIVYPKFAVRTSRIWFVSDLSTIQRYQQWIIKFDKYPHWL